MVNVRGTRWLYHGICEDANEDNASVVDHSLTFVYHSPCRRGFQFVAMVVGKFITFHHYPTML